MSEFRSSICRSQSVGRKKIQVKMTSLQRVRRGLRRMRTTAGFDGLRRDVLYTGLSARERRGQVSRVGHDPEGSLLRVFYEIWVWLRSCCRCWVRALQMRVKHVMTLAIRLQGRGHNGVFKLPGLRLRTAVIRTSRSGPSTLRDNIRAGEQRGTFQGGAEDTRR
jgi:hypothetical protein